MGVVLAFWNYYSTTTYECRIPTNGNWFRSIVSALELPVSVTMAFVLLNEDVKPFQWFGIVLIIIAIIIMNVNFKRKQLEV
jgi:drug/metabolite transporter (DMT)-like permease